MAKGTRPQGTIGMLLSKGSRKPMPHFAAQLLTYALKCFPLNSQLYVFLFFKNMKLKIGFRDPVSTYSAESPGRA